MRRSHPGLLVFVLVLFACDTLNLGTSSSTSSTSSSSTSSTSSTIITAPTTTTTGAVIAPPALGITGQFTGTVEFAPIPGATGASFTSLITLTLDECGAVTLVQQPDQPSSGSGDTNGEVLRLDLIGEGADYREGYTLYLDPADDPEVGVWGVNVGGGHGLGNIPTATTLRQMIDLLLAALDPTGAGSPAAVPGELPPLDGVDWAYTVLGTLTRTGAAPPCD